VLFVIDKDVAKQVAVTVGSKIGDLVQVSGVKPGDKIVLTPSEKIKDGGAVAIQKK
jgi:multidrug efflux pump subunit AcrA (membrane-fusion protein)